MTVYTNGQLVPWVTSAKKGGQRLHSSPTPALFWWKWVWPARLVVHMCKGILYWLAFYAAYWKRQYPYMYRYRTSQLAGTVYTHIQQIQDVHTAQCDFRIWTWFLRKYVYFCVIRLDFNPWAIADLCNWIESGQGLWTPHMHSAANL